MQAKACEKLKAILASLPLHQVYEESKKSGVTNLNPALRDALQGRSESYPGIRRAKCDVVFTVDNECIWLEVKLVQTHYGGSREEWRYEDSNPMVDKHLGLFESRHHSAVRDVRDRLPTLDDVQGVDRIAFLMVAYYSPRWPLQERLERFEQLGRLENWAKQILLEMVDPTPKAMTEQAMICAIYWERMTRNRELRK
jgi:hypothetical protein